MSPTTAPPRPLSIALLGAGSVAQTIWLPTLTLLPHYRILSICDISPSVAAHCASKYHIPQHTTSPSSIFSNPAIEAVFILTSDEYHEDLCIRALEAGKWVMLEKPMTLSLPSAHRILDAEKRAKNGARVFVGYMRRYAPSFAAFKREVETLRGEVLYARVRDIIGPNGFFIEQSGTFPVQGAEDIPEEAVKERERRVEMLVEEAWRGPLERYPQAKGLEGKREICRFLGGLGSHDLSLMREVLGPAKGVVGVSVHRPFYSAILEFEGFSTTYETGVDNLGRFDAHMAVYGKNKTVMIQYDTPFIKGLPIKVKVDEVIDGEVVTREIVSSYEDAYTAEAKELYECVVNGKPIKTTAEDALQDLELFDKIYEQLARQESLSNDTLAIT